MQTPLRKSLVSTARGLTLIELIVATTILLVLSGMAVPMARVTIKRERERQLRQALWAMRDGIDRYKDAADRGAFQIKVGSESYPTDFDWLVKGGHRRKGGLPPFSFAEYDNFQLLQLRFER